VAPLNTKFLVWRNISLKEFALVGIVHFISSFNYSLDMGEEKISGTRKDWPKDILYKTGCKQLNGREIRQRPYFFVRRDHGVGSSDHFSN